ncbi:recombinase family protein [Kitasatospora sp. NPDC094016]|uniref:recombinase family protein n=1 Tax=Kitasatospora sp. NPDC094016 TaxID=3154986 RepID=UPI00331A52F7
MAKGRENNGHFEDVGKSGWDPDVTRPGFEEMMAAVRAGRVDAVIVVSLSRLTRQGALEAMRINEELARYGVRLVPVNVTRHHRGPSGLPLLVGPGAPRTLQMGNRRTEHPASQAVLPVHRAPSRG